MMKKKKIQQIISELEKINNEIKELSEKTRDIVNNVIGDNKNTWAPIQTATIPLDNLP